MSGKEHETLFHDNPNVWLCLNLIDVIQIHKRLLTSKIMTLHRHSNEQQNNVLQSIVTHVILELCMTPGNSHNKSPPLFLASSHAIHIHLQITRFFPFM